MTSVTGGHTGGHTSGHTGGTAELAALGERLRRARRALDQQAGAARTVATAGQRVAAEVTHLTGQVHLHEQAAHLLAGISEARQLAAQQQIETLVTQGLRTIFGDDLSFHVIQTVRAKTPVVDFVVRSTLTGPQGEAQIVETDLDDRGGGMRVVVGFLLRLVILLLSHRGPSTGGGTDTLMLLDETFAHVSAEYLPRVASFVRELVDATGVQIIMVTHSEVFAAAADTRYRFELRDGLTHVTAE